MWANEIDSKREPTGEDQVSYKLLNFKSTHQQQRQQSAWRRNQNIATWERRPPTKTEAMRFVQWKVQKMIPPAIPAGFSSCEKATVFDFFLFGFGWRYSSFSFSLFTYLSHSFAFVFLDFFSGRNKIYTKFIYIFLWTASRLFSNDMFSREIHSFSLVFGYTYTFS